jgi:hypothetical protein
MGGGLMQLVAYGAQDVYLTGNPEITFFKVVYRRHTNFAIEMNEMNVDSGGARPDSQCNVQILRNGDLATRMYLRVVTPQITAASVTQNANPTKNGQIAWVRRLGHALIRNVKITIGGTEIDKHIGVWLDIWYELTHTVMQERGYEKMIGDVPELTTLTGPQSTNTSEVLLPSRTLYIPLQFWFCRNPGLALPLVALQYHDVRVQIDFESASKLFVSSGLGGINVNNLSFQQVGLMVDYVFLDSEERRRFAQVGHEYLIEQVQFPSEETLTGAGSVTASSRVNQKVKLNFNHPCKEIVWALRCGAYNGSSLSSTGTSGRGHFLGYTNNSQRWDEAVNYAAANVASGAFLQGVVTAASGVFTNSLVSDATTSTLLPGESVVLNYSAGNFITTASGKQINVSVVLKNTGALPLATNPFTLWYTKSPIVSKDTSLTNLLDYLAGANALLTINVGVTAWTGTTNYTIDSLVAVASGHQLSLREVSVPVEDYTDNRYKPSSASNPWDVAVVQLNNYGLCLDGSGNPVAEGNIQLNAHNRFEVRQGSYFNYVQPYQHHTRTPADGINSYSFCLKPEDHQPTGTANLSRIDTTMLNMTFADPLRGADQQDWSLGSSKTVVPLDFVTDSRLYIFATNYNVLRIMSGMGGLAYSN